MSEFLDALRKAFGRPPQDPHPNEQIPNPLSERPQVLLPEESSHLNDSFYQIEEWPGGKKQKLEYIIELEEKYRDNPEALEKIATYAQGIDEEHKLQWRKH